jgi:hypothetical protein
MKICKYGITLRRITKDDLEYIRLKNNPEPVDPLDLNDEITPMMQQSWFESINNLENIYYIIEYKGIKAGILSTKNIDWGARTSESDLTFWDESFFDSHIPMLALLSFLEVGFYYLKWKTSYFSGIDAHPKAIEFATKLGFKPLAHKGNKSNLTYLLTKELFETKGKKAYDEAQSFVEEESGDGFLILEPADYESGIAQKIENHITETGVYLHRKGKAGSRIYFR